VNTPIKSLDIPVRARNALEREELFTVEQVAARLSTEGLRGIQRIPGIGGASSDEIINACFRFIYSQIQSEEGKLRARIATMVMQSLVADAGSFDCDDVHARAAALAREAYIYADALIAAGKDGKS
jgi:hypothetical protein